MTYAESPCDDVIKSGQLSAVETEIRSESSPPTGVETFDLGFFINYVLNAITGADLPSGVKCRAKLCDLPQ